jgi:hypothetical protein
MCKQLLNALGLFTGMYDILYRRFGDPNVLAFLHVNIFIIHHLTFAPDAMAYVAPTFPWNLTAFRFNTLLTGSAAASSRAAAAQDVSQAPAPLLESAQFLGTAEVRKHNSEDDSENREAPGVGAAVTSGRVTGTGRKKKPLPDDYSIRGFPWTETYFPDEFFVTEVRIDNGKKYFQLPSILEERRER